MDDRPDPKHDEWLPPARIEARPYIDPSYSVVHDNPPAPRRDDGNDWIIPVAIVMAGIVLAVAVIISRRAPQPAPVISTSPPPASTIQTLAPPPPVVAPTLPPVTSSEDSAAQKTLEDVVAAARSIRGQTGSYAGVTSFELARMLPANSYQPPDSASTGPTDVSISAEPTIFSAAALSETGTCFWIRDFDGTRSTYGVGDPCTGTAALDAMLPAWPIAAAPSGSPAVIP